MRRRPIIAIRLALLPLLIGAAGTVLPACRGERPADCADVFAHLDTLAPRPASEPLRARFIEYCVVTWNAQRMQCLRDATTPDEALECKPERVRPQ